MVRVAPGAITSLLLAVVSHSAAADIGTGDTDLYVLDLGAIPSPPEKFGTTVMRRYSAGDGLPGLQVAGNDQHSVLFMENDPQMQAANDPPLTRLSTIGSEEAYAFTVDGNAFYIADEWHHRVVRWEMGADEGVLLAGGNGRGPELNQLSNPTDVAVFRPGPLHSDHGKEYLYVCDSRNHRVVRWALDPESAEGPVVVAGASPASVSTQIACKIATPGRKICAGVTSELLDTPLSISVDQRTGRLFVIDAGNHRVIVWEQGASRGRSLVAAAGPLKNKLFGTTLGDRAQGLAVVNGHNDTEMVVYVSDTANHRVFACTYASPFPLTDRCTDNPILCGGEITSEYNVTKSDCYTDMLGIGEPDPDHVSTVNSTYEGDPWILRTFCEVTCDSCSFTCSVVAGDSSAGPSLAQLNYPRGLSVREGELYIADTGNARIVRWPLSNTEGEIRPRAIVAGGSAVLDANGEKSVKRPVDVFALSGTTTSTTITSSTQTATTATSTTATVTYLSTTSVTTTVTTISTTTTTQTDSTTMTTTTKLCNGSPDPSMCSKMFNARECGQQIVGFLVSEVCPVMCDTCGSRSDSAGTDPAEETTPASNLGSNENPPGGGASTTIIHKHTTETSMLTYVALGGASLVLLIALYLWCTVCKLKTQRYEITNKTPPSTVDRPRVRGTADVHTNPAYSAPETDFDNAMDTGPIWDSPSSKGGDYIAMERSSNSALGLGGPGSYLELTPDNDNGAYLETLPHSGAMTRDLEVDEVDAIQHALTEASNGQGAYAHVYPSRIGGSQFESDTYLGISPANDGEESSDDESPPPPPSGGGAAYNDDDGYDL